MIEIQVLKGDITKVNVDVVVNAANSSLLGGGGVDGAIHRAGGSAILEECKKIRAKQGGCKVGEAVITTGGNLPAQYVIHTVGPVWSGQNEGEKDQLLTSCYKNSLQLAIDHQLKSIAFPNISTGIYRFPKQRAAQRAIQTIREFSERQSNSKVELEQIIFVCFDQDNFQIYQKLLGT